MASSLVGLGAYWSTFKVILNEIVYYSCNRSEENNYDSMKGARYAAALVEA